MGEVRELQGQSHRVGRELPATGSSPGQPGFPTAQNRVRHQTPSIGAYRFIDILIVTFAFEFTGRDWTRHTRLSPDTIG